MRSIKFARELAIVPLLVAGASVGASHWAVRAQNEPNTTDTVQVAETPLTIMLPDTLGHLKATGDANQYQPDQLEALAGGKAANYREYKVTASASRVYGAYRVDVFRCQTRSGAFGLFTYSSGDGVPTQAGDKPVQTSFGPGGASLWSGNCFVRVGSADAQNSPNRAGVSQIAAAISPLIGSAAPLKLPSLVDSLPQDNHGAQRAHYFLGPQSLNEYVAHGADMFAFGGGAEAVLAPYKQESETAGPLNLLIVEYNTPQFAHEALDRASTLVSSLSPEEQAKIVLKRIGNYIVEASNVADRPQGEKLVDSIKYPYTVKWFQVPFHRKQDPHAGQKAAQIILSSFGIVALGLAGALTGGGIFGTVIFLRRRRQQREVFSDAGGMLRLDIEELCVGINPAALPQASSGLPGSDDLG